MIYLNKIMIQSYIGESLSMAEGREVVIMNENENIQNVNGAETPIDNQDAVQPTPNTNPQPQNPNPQAQYVYAQSAPKAQGFDFGKEMGNTFSDVMNIIKTPADSIPKFVGKSSIVSSLTIAIIYAIVRIVFGMINTAITYGGYSYISAFDRAASFVTSFFANLLIAAATMAIIAALVMVCGNVFSKTKISFFKGLSIASLFVIPVIPAVVLNFLFGLANAAFGSVFMVLGNVIGYIFVAMALKNEIKDNNKLPYIVAGIFFCVSFAEWLLYVIF